MTVWIVFVWFSTSPPITMGSFETKAECIQQASVYRDAQCVSVVVPKPRRADRCGVSSPGERASGKE